MKKTLLIIAVLGTLALSACSSDDKTDATPGNDTPNPQVTDSTPGGTVAEGSDADFCQALKNTDALGTEVNATSQAMTDIINDTANIDSPETLAALKTQGATMVEQADEVANLFNVAASKADNSEVAAGLNTMADFFLAYYQPMGQAAIDAESVMDYALNIGTTFNTEDMTVMMDEVTAAGQVVSDYATAVCGTTF